MRNDQVVKPWEQKLRELDALWWVLSVSYQQIKSDIVSFLLSSMTLPQGSDVHMECMTCREKMKAALDNFQVSKHTSTLTFKIPSLPPSSLSPPSQSAMEEQMRMVKGGRDLSSLERIPTPVPPPQLAMVQSMMMRPGFYPMVSFPRPPISMGNMMRAQMAGVPATMVCVCVCVLTIN